MRLFTTLFFLLVFCKTVFSQSHEPDSAMVLTTEGCKYIDYYFGDSLTYSWSGKCENGWVNGSGVLTKHNRGEEFSATTANFISGVAQGNGEFKLIQTNQKYKGQFVNGQLIGEGEYWNERGDYYKGQILNCKLHGRGKMTYGNGSVFQGTFRFNNFWTGNFTNLKDEVIYFYRGEKIDKLRANEVYKPKLGVELTEYFNAEWKQCNKKDAVYFRKITYEAPNKPKGKIRDFYINGGIQNEYYALYVDYYDDQMTFFKKSKGVFFHTNGNPSSISCFDHQSRKCGKEYTYYESGELLSESNFGEFGLLHGPHREYYKNGNLRGYSKYSNGIRLNNAYWQITEDGIWIGSKKMDFENEIDRFQVEGSCANPSEYSGMLFIDIKDKDCSYYNPNIAQSKHEFPFSLELDAMMDKPHKDKTIGLIFNYVDENNFSAVKLNGGGLYSIISINKGAESILVQWSGLDLPKEKDKMNFDVLLSFVSNELILEINDVELNRIPFQPKEDMEYGLYFKGKGLSLIRTLGEIIYFDEETSKGYLNFALAEKEGKSLSSEESEFTGNGSGFLITNDGYIATNYHVIEDVSEINVVFDVDGEQLSYSGEVVHSDKDNDVAIIKVDLSDRKVQLPYVLASKLQEVGSSIFALGYPYADVMGSEIKYTNGAVNARTGLQGDVRFYQVSAQVQPGNSGGPCFNEKGEIIGIVSAMLDDAVYENQNVNYVLKISYLKNLMELLPSKSTEFNPKVSKYGSTQDMIKDYKNFVPIIYTK
jgi:S1-C subfamily serine protease